MAKQSGLGDRLWVDGNEISGDIGAVDNISGGNTPLAVPGINAFAQQRIGGRRDGQIDFTSFFNKTAVQADGEHPVLRTLPTADRIVTYFRGTPAGGQAASCVAKQINYDPSRGDDGSLTFKVSAQANGFGVEWGTNMGITLQGGPGNVAGVDFGAASTFGLQAYLHVSLFTGTSMVVKLQESSDNGSVDPYADVVGGAFATVTSAPQAQRIATAGNLAVERWLRVVTTGTFSAAAFAVVVVRNPVATVF